jgi:hypothetical protein
MFVRIWALNLKECDSLRKAGFLIEDFRLLIEVRGAGAKHNGHEGTQRKNALRGKEDACEASPQ